MNNILKKVFAWMCAGLLVTFATGYIVSINSNMIGKIFTPSSVIILGIVEIALVLFLSIRITKMNPTTARIMFLLYSFVTGLTFSSVFIAYDMSSITIVFLITAILFGILSLIGYTTTADLTKLGTYLMIGLFAIIITSIINIFIGNTTIEIVICSISIIIFLGITAYDIQKIKQMSGYIEDDNLAIYGALQLYIDFINLFLDLLRLFGNSRD